MLFEQSDQLKKPTTDYDSDDADEMTHTLFATINNQNLFESSSLLKPSGTSKTKRNSAKQRSKTKLTFGNLNNQFNLDEISSNNQSIIINQTSHTLPKSSKQLNSIKLKSQLNQLNQINTNKQETTTLPNEDQLNRLFGNLNDIYQFNSIFLSQLIQCEFDAVQIAQCFVDNANGFHVYSQYCTNYPKQVETLTELNRNTRTNQLLKIRQIELGHSLPLGSYLLKPVQRILKYHLLLNNMVKHFEIEQPTNTNNNELNCNKLNNTNDHEQQQQTTSDHQSLRNALDVMTNIAAHINTMKKKHEHAVRVQEIQSLLIGWQGEDLTTFGELVAEGTFKLFGNKTSRHLFLFDKLLLVVKKKDESLFTYKAHILVSDLLKLILIIN